MEDQNFCFPTLYSPKTGGKYLIWTIFSLINRDGQREIVTVYGDEHGEKQCARKLVVPKAKRNFIEQALLRMRNRYLMQLRCAPYYSPIRGEVDHPSMMKAYTFEPGKTKLAFPVAYQPKVDGIRICCFRQGNEITILTYQGKKKTNLSHLIPQLEILLAYLPSTCKMVDGELLHVDGLALNDIVSIFNTSKVVHKDITKLYLCVFDIYVPGVAYVERLQFLQQALCLYRKTIPRDQRVLHSLPTKTAQDMDELRRAFVWSITHTYRNTHVEGLMIKKLDAIYVSNRSNNILKWKSVKDGEYLIVGHTLATGVHSGAVVFRMITKDGKEFNAVPSMSLKERRLLAEKAQEYYGKYATVEYYNLTVNGLPHHGTMKCIRNYE